MTVASWPPAPERFSMRTGCSQISLSFEATRRAVMSVALPGEKPTTRRTGLVGNFCCACARAGAVATESPAAMTAACTATCHVRMVPPECFARSVERYLRLGKTNCDGLRTLLHPLNSQKRERHLLHQACRQSVRRESDTPPDGPDRQRAAVVIAPRKGLAPSSSGYENGTLMGGWPGSAPRLAAESGRRLLRSQSRCAAVRTARLWCKDGEAFYTPSRPCRFRRCAPGT